MMLFNIGKQSIPTPQEEYNKMFGNNEDDKIKIIEVDVELLDEIKDQPFVFRKEKAEQLVDSVKQVGILEPILVRHKKNERYDIIAGRHRAAAAKMAGLKEVPVIVKDVTVDIAKFILLSTNTDRNNDYSYSELAYAYKEQAELLNKLGNNSTTSKVAENYNTNRKQIYRYIRLTYLNKQLLKMVDTGQIPFTVAVDLSYFSVDNQSVLFKYLLNKNLKISVKQGKKLKLCQQKCDIQKCDNNNNNKLYNKNNISINNYHISSSKSKVSVNKKNTTEKLISRIKELTLYEDMMDCLNTDNSFKALYHTTVTALISLATKPFIYRDEKIKQDSIHKLIRISTRDDTYGLSLRDLLYTVIEKFIEIKDKYNIHNITGYLKSMLYTEMLVGEF